MSFKYFKIIFVVYDKEIYCLELKSLNYLLLENVPAEIHSINTC